LNKKTVVFIISSSDIGGAERNALQIASALKKIYNILIICNGGYLSEEFKKAGFKTKIIPLRDNIDIIGFTRLILFLRRIKPDILHLHMNRASLLGAIAGKFLKIPTLSSMQSFTRYIYARFSDEITVCSPRMVDYFESFGISRKKISLIYNPVFPNMTDNIKAFSGYPDGFNILFVGRLHPKKGILQIPYFAKRALSDNLNITFHVIGDGIEEKRLKNEISKYGLEKNIIMYGKIEDVRPFLKGCDLMILPSQSEGLPLSLSEGLFFSKPFVAYDVGDTRILSDNGGGIMVKPEDKDGFYKCIKELYYDREKLNSMGKKGRKFIEDYFDIDTALKKIINIYNRLGEKDR